MDKKVENLELEFYKDISKKLDNIDNMSLTEQEELIELIEKLELTDERSHTR